MNGPSNPSRLKRRISSRRDTGVSRAIYVATSSGRRNVIPPSAGIEHPFARLNNIQSSILQRLKNYSDEKHEDYGLTLSRFAIERFLYRLSISDYKQQLVLKGAQLFHTWTKTPYRPTRDLDLLRFGSADISELVLIFQSICKVQTDSQDGIEFLADTVRVETIRDQDEYQGVRIKLEYRIGRAGQFMQIDVGFGDIITPSAKDILLCHFFS